MSGPDILSRLHVCPDYLDLIEKHNKDNNFPLYKSFNTRPTKELLEEATNQGKLILASSEAEPIPQDRLFRKF